MNAEQWQQVSTLLDRLLEMDEAARQIAVEQLRHGDPDLFREVESLLEQQTSSERFETPPATLMKGVRSGVGLSTASFLTSSTVLVWPERAGRFLIREEIARGGMGAVLRAFDPDFQRTLAVKVLLPHLGSHRDVEGRFLREAQITGRLQHPGIPPIHELGRLENNSPFFAMKLIEGQTLSALIGETEPAERATRFVGDFELICRTLAYAHNQGIIHRDLKPSNVMVGAFGEVQVMDWGLAKDLRNTERELGSAALGDGPELSYAGDVSGTPAYMAPEQARGEVAKIDKGSDVFGLGGLLCAMLTGLPPFTGTSAQMLRLAAEGDLKDALDRLERSGADAELIAIARRCLAPVPADRFADAGEVAEAVTHYRASAQEKLRNAEMEQERLKVKAAEERRRRRVTLAMSGVLAVVFAVGFALVTWYWSLADSRRKSAEEAQDNLKLERDRSDETAGQARDAVKQSFILATENPEFQRDGMQEARRLMLDKALAYFRGFTVNRRDDPALRVDLADAHGRIGHILAERGELNDALNEYSQAIERYELTRKESPDPEIEYALARVLNAKARTETSLGRRDAAAETLRRSMPIVEKLARGEPKNVRLQLLHSETWTALGNVHYRTEKLIDALKAFQEARNILEPLRKEGVRIEVFLAGYSNALVSIGHIYKDQSKSIDAAAIYGEAVKIREELLAAFPFPIHRSELARTYGSLAYVQDDRQAVKTHERAIELRERLVEANKTVLDYREDLAISYLNYGDALRADPKRINEGLSFRQKSLDQFLILTKSAPDVVAYQHGAANAHVAVALSYRRDLKQTEPATAHLKSARDIWQKLEDRGVANAEHRSRFAFCLSQFALIQLYAKEYPAAIEQFEKSNSIYERLRSTGFNTATCKYEMSVNFANISYCRQEQGQWEDSLRAAMKTVELREELVREAPQEVEYQTKLKSALANLLDGARGFVQRTTPRAKSAAPEDQLVYRQACLAKWQVLARDYPKAPVFQESVAECYYQIAIVEASQKDDAKRIDRIVTALRQALVHGSIAVKRIESEKVFAPYLQSTEFQILLKNWK